MLHPTGQSMLKMQPINLENVSIRPLLFRNFNFIKMNRRQFIERLGLLSGAGFTISGIPLRALANPFQRKQEDDNILVLIQLAGGNDGLNTLVPFEDDLYYKSRPTLALPKNQLHQVNS